MQFRCQRPVDVASEAPRLFDIAVNMAKSKINNKHYQDKDSKKRSGYEFAPSWSSKPYVVCECGRGWMYEHKIRAESYCNKCGAYYLAQLSARGAAPSPTVEQGRPASALKKAENDGQHAAVEALRRLQVDTRDLEGRAGRDLPGCEARSGTG